MELEENNESLHLRLLKFQKRDNTMSILPPVLDKNNHTPVIKSMQETAKKGKGAKGEPLDPI